MNQPQGQQVSMEDALAAFRQRCGELADENVLLKARAASLERQITGLEAENARLRETPQPSPADAGNEPG
ncbi:hypothetical protein ABZX40_13635 [Streptomyces sp. NPDC004610]|uniref:hypothetical protein n=1 Tax=unclassified Streptomyces TaxID=2593676 RepID=UPI0033A85CBD